MMLFIFHCLLLVTFKNFRNTHVIPFEVQNGAHTTYPVKFLVFSVGNIGKYNFSVHSVIRSSTPPFAKVWIQITPKKTTKESIRLALIQQRLQAPPK